MKRVSTQDVYWNGDTLDVLLDKIQTALSIHGPLSKLHVGIDYDGEPELSIAVMREETDEEEQERLNTFKTIEARQKADRKKLFEKLKKEFNGD